MDVSLRCNSLKCRTELVDNAVVTTCSHIFCVPCSETLGLASPGPNGSARTCPACATILANPDDVVVTQLNPTEDYKTSVLSGLNPNIIMECAGRGLSFYSYQTTQEIIYQEFLAKSLTDRYSNLNTQMDKIINDANSEIMSLREKLGAMHLEQKNLEQKNRDLADKFKEKAKAQQTLQRLYQSLKAQQLAAGMEVAADYDAEHVLQTAGHPKYDTTTRRHSRASSNDSGSRSRTIDAFQNQGYGAREVPLVPRNSNAQIPPTPSGHRARLPLYGGNGAASTGGSQAVSNTSRHQGTALRPVFGNLDPNIYGNAHNPGFGMSAGVKVGRQQEGPLGRSGYAVNRAPGGVGFPGR